METMTLSLSQRLAAAGRGNFENPQGFERAFCDLLIRMEPECKLHRILESLPDSQSPLDLPAFLNVMSNLGYDARFDETKASRIESRLLPCLFIAQDGTPFAITEAGQTGGTGTAWFFRAREDGREATSRFMRDGSGYSWFRALLGRFRQTIVHVALAGFALNILMLATPVLIMLVYDRVIAASAADVLPMLLIGAGIALVFEFLLRSLRSRGVSWIAARLDNIVGNAIFAHLVNLPPDLIEKASVAAQIARIKTFESVRDFFSGSVFLSLMELPFVFLAILLVGVIAGPLVIVPVLMIFAYLALFFTVLSRVKTSIRLAAKASSARQQFTIETFEKLDGIRSYGLMEKWQAKFRVVSGRERLAHFHLGWHGMVGETGAHALTVFASVLSVGIGVHLIWAGSMTAGALVASMILVWKILTPFYSLCTMVPRLEQLRNSILQINRLMDLQTEKAAATGSARLPMLRGAVRFVNVGLRYAADSDPVFSGLSFDVAPGGIVAITGGNGTGKSSALKLIKGLYRPTSGAVRIDGFDIRQLDPHDLRRQTAYVPQAPQFFSGSILENLRAANPLATIQEIEDALALADANDAVQGLPHGAETRIGRQGDYALSSGLATRLCLARAYLHSASLLLLDELPNTFLNGRAGDNLKSYLTRTKGRRTTIMVTYREDFMAIADTLIILRRGEAPLAGSPQTLLSTVQEAA